MVADTPGIHHVTGIVGDAQEAVDFYAGVLGLRPVIRTVNFEDILQHHLYFGDARGTPGTVFTCFPDPYADTGRVGKPQVDAVAFRVPDGSLPYWRDRLEADGIDAVGPLERFADRFLRLVDPVGTRLELVADSDASDAVAEPWPGSNVPAEAAIRDLYGVSTVSLNPYATASTLETLGFVYDEERDDRVRYRAPGDRAMIVDVRTAVAADTKAERGVSFGREGPGTIHHVAVRVESEEMLYEWRDLFDDRGGDVSRVKDRHFFHSLYVREPGGILFELATETDGVAADPPLDANVLDSTNGRERVHLPLSLPDWFEDDRELIESQLPPLSAPVDKRDQQPGETGGADTDDEEGT
ncbi:VOC family protein [Natrarchaeobius chitinivorans]|uniref:Ring-cleaving dioxygenase n=1 Tax=Natrarchaeobius chitinivorans TaxID=1679083 RepID=A0A3N6LVD2_NATCH|nr:VOC family protein [Natrarchaeobius chitinivorans]RQG94373.1 ring-cleaving dioxygenase [Natrarchaeobius chitinivorans]